MPETSQAFRSGMPNEFASRALVPILLARGLILFPRGIEHLTAIQLV